MASKLQTDVLQYRRYFTVLEETTKKPKVRVYSTAILSLVAITLFGWFAIKPTLQTIFYLRKEIADKQIINQKMEDKIMALIEAQATYQQIQPQLAFLDQAVPNNPEAVELIIQLRHLANITQATISAIQVAQTPILGQDESTKSAKKVPTTPDAAKETAAAPTVSQQSFPLGISVGGTYEAVRAFLQGLFAMRRVVNVDSMKISKKSEALSEGEQLITIVDPTIQIELTLTGYYRKK